MDPFSQPTLDQLAAFGPGGLEDGEGPCERCGASPSRTNEYMSVMSFVVFTRHRRYPARLCRACGTRVGLTELVKSALLGWWGIPWGLLTFGALVTNVRSLSRWSRIPKAVVLTLALLALAAPAGLAVYWVHHYQSVEAAKSTGDWGSEEMVAEVDEGHRLSGEGKHAEALAAYLRAHKLAPGSSVVNFSIATTYVALGAPAKALPYAARAEELAPRRGGYVALHGWLLLESGDAAGARAKAAALAGLEPEDAADAAWMTDLLYSVEDWEALDRTAQAAAAKFPADAIFPNMRLFALLGKDDLAGYATVHDALSEERRKERDVTLAEGLHRLRTEPAAQLPALLAAWAAGEFPDVPMRLAVQMATRAGYLDAARKEIRTWLRSPRTPGDAWGYADLWLPAEELPGALDAYLAERPEPLPALMRIGSLDWLRDRPRRLALARRAREVAHPFAANLDNFYVNQSRRTQSAADWQSEMRQHLAAHPDHQACRVILAGEVVEEDPAAARAMLDEVGAAASEELAANLALARAEILLAEGNTAEAGKALDEAEAKAGGDPGVPENVRILRMELALRDGDWRALESHFAAVGEKEAEARAAALVLRWSGELAAGQPLTYRQDVDAWLAGADVATLRPSLSRSTQALLLLEGRSDAATARLAFGPSPSPTLPWVTLLREAATTGAVDEAALAAVADGAPRYAWAARIARLVREHRAQASGVVALARSRG